MWCWHLGPSGSQVYCKNLTGVPWHEVLNGRGDGWIGSAGVALGQWPVPRKSPSTSAILRGYLGGCELRVPKGWEKSAGWALGYKGRPRVLPQGPEGKYLLVGSGTPTWSWGYLQKRGASQQDLPGLLVLQYEIQFRNNVLFCNFFYFYET